MKELTGVESVTAQQQELDETFYTLLFSTCSNTTILTELRSLNKKSGYHAWKANSTISPFTNINKNQKHAKVGYSIKIRGDKIEESSFMHKSDLNCSNFTKIAVQFWYFTKNMKVSKAYGRDKFVLEYTNDGGNK